MVITNTMNKLGCIFFVLFATAGLAQESVSTELNGKVNADMSNLEGIYVINLKTEKAVITDQQGYFSIKAIVGDTLMFSSIQYKGLKIALTKDDFNKRLFFVKMVPVMNQLNEVVIKRYNNINSRSLGIIPENQRSYTEAERKLATATGLNPSASLSGMAGGSISADPLLNFLSGRTAMLKKELEVEKKEAYLVMLDEMFDLDQYVGKFQIPLLYVKGFQYYAVDNDKFTKILDQKNKTTIEFLLGELASKYKEIIACENE
ncbi:hypothetical protein [Flavobacterium sp. WC2429]|jgi:hypothetical protein|uniref:Carboxypeptidase-like regulatory domain-containing protein n=1 Tax=Flavobacterium sp. WC2429 TaxID=3234140 RepID=A0AB39WPU3_9FLAO